jgi:ZIP family zinc transporter
VPVLDEEDEISSTAAIYSPALTATRSNTGADERWESDDGDLEGQHHHHVPENAFMSIGLQTSIAIALHKLPEGFITYATNHANPSLGFSVFMALFIHNITEGFALALPLFLAFGSRFRAMLWASLLGGISQPLGAGVAALWFKIAGRDGHQPGSAAYGCMFAVTAGIMASVALQLFVEGLGMNHNQNLCTAFSFIGMGIMGVSGALTA